jgi:hypothetical protein
MLASVGLVMVAQELPPWSKCTPEGSCLYGFLSAVGSWPRVVLVLPCLSFIGPF